MFWIFGNATRTC